MRDTSISAFNDMQWSGQLGAQEQAIIDYMNSHAQAKTRRQIALDTGLEINAVCGRVNSLIKYGRLVENVKGKCSITGRKVWLVEIAA